MSVTGQRFVLPTAFDVNAAGIPYIGGKLYFYASGGTTPQDTYSNVGLTVPNSNPVVADAAGHWGNIFLGALAYRVALTDANDVPIWTYDPVSAPPSLGTQAVVLTTNAALVTTQFSAFVEISGGGGITITLPTPVGNGGNFFTFFLNTSGTVTLSTPAGAFTGPTGSVASTCVLTPANSVFYTVQSDNTNWIVAGQINTTSSGAVSVAGLLTAYGNIVVNMASPYIYLRGTNGQNASLQLAVGATLRWQVYKDNTAEAGANVGSDFSLGRFDDAGAYIDSPLVIKRSTGVTTVTKMSASTVGFYGTTPVASKPAVTGDRAGNAALASLLTTLAAFGLITDSTT